MLPVLDVLLIVFYYLLLRVFAVYLSLYSMYVMTSISIGLYPDLDLWNAIKLHYITVYTVTWHTDSTKVLYFQNVMWFYGTHINFILFTPIRKVWLSLHQCTLNLQMPNNVMCRSFFTDSRPYSTRNVETV
jgi:hypothetical protein